MSVILERSGRHLGQHIRFLRQGSTFITRLHSHSCVYTSWDFMSRNKYSTICCDDYTVLKNHVLFMTIRRKNTSTQSYDKNGHLSPPSSSPHHQDNQECSTIYTINDNKSYYNQIKNLYHIEDMNGIIKLHDSIKVKDMKISDTAVVNIIINAYLKLQRYDKVDDIINQDNECRYSLDSASYTTVIKHLMTNNAYYKAQEMYNMMKRSGVSIDDSQPGAIILDLLMHEQDYTEVTAVLKELTDKKLHNSVTYSTLMKGYMKAGRYDKAYNVYKVMKQSGISIENPKAGSIILDLLMFQKDYTEVTLVLMELTERNLLDLVSYGVLMKGYMKAGRYDKAYNVYKVMKQSGISIENPKAGSIILDLLMFQKDYTEVTLVLMELTERNLLDLVTYCILMKGYMKVGKHSKAREVYDYMKQSGVSIDGTQAGSIILDMLMHVQDYTEVTAVLKKLTDKKLLNNVTYSTLMKGYMRAGELNKAREVYETMKQSNILITNSQVGNIILDLLMHQQDYDEANIVVQQMMKRKLLTLVSYSTLIKGYMNAGKYDQAREVYEYIKQSNLRLNLPQTQGIMIDLLIRCNDFTEAELVLQKAIDGNFDTSSCYSTLIKGYMRDNNYQSAQRVYDKLKHAKMHIDTSISGNIILDFLLKTHNVQEAMTVFKDLLDKKLVDEYTVSTMKAGLKNFVNTQDIKDLKNMLLSYFHHTKYESKSNRKDKNNDLKGGNKVIR